MARRPDLSRRFIVPELLDYAPPEEAAKSLRDLRRINRYFGGVRTLRGVMRPLLYAGGTVLDVGAATGDQGAALPEAAVTCADLSFEHLQRGAGTRVVCDAFALPFGPGSFDFVIANLFMHHFSDEGIIELLRSFRRTARQGVVITDLERQWLAWRFLPWTAPLFRWHPLTLHDGPASVAAAFRPVELQALFERAGMPGVQVKRHWPWFRLSAVWTADQAATGGLRRP